jgi:hypothetical protein
LGSPKLPVATEYNRPQPAGQGNRPISKSEAPSAAAECPDYSEQIDVDCFDSAEAANAVKHN